jgi:hypothetical protein
MTEDDDNENYRSHVETLHEHLCDLVSSKLSNGHENHDGNTKGSTDFRSSKENGYTVRKLTLF